MQVYYTVHVCPTVSYIFPSFCSCSEMRENNMYSIYIFKPLQTWNDFHIGKASFLVAYTGMNKWRCSPESKSSLSSYSTGYTQWSIQHDLVSHPPLGGDTHDPSNCTQGCTEREAANWWNMQHGIPPQSRSLWLGTMRAIWGGPWSNPLWQVVAWLPATPFRKHGGFMLEGLLIAPEQCEWGVSVYVWGNTEGSNLL